MVLPHWYLSDPGFIQIFENGFFPPDLPPPPPRTSKLHSRGRTLAINSLARTGDGKWIFHKRLETRPGKHMNNLRRIIDVFSRGHDPSVYKNEFHAWRHPRSAGRQFSGHENWIINNRTLEEMPSSPSHTILIFPDPQPIPEPPSSTSTEKWCTKWGKKLEFKLFLLIWYSANIKSELKKRQERAGTKSHFPNLDDKSFPPPRAEGKKERGREK